MAVLHRAGDFDMIEDHRAATENTKGEGKLGDVAKGRRTGRRCLTSRP
jgi:hypothetical protein